MATRRAVLCLLLVLIGVGALVTWHVLRADAAKTVQLPNGQTLTLVRVDYEKRHRERTGNRWRDHVGALLPEALARKIGARHQALGGGTNELTLWFKLSRGQSPTPAVKCSLSDGHGCPMDVDHPYWFSPADGKDLWFVFSFGFFTSRTPRLNLQVCAAGTNGQCSIMGEFEVANPSQRQFPTWPAAAPLPLTQTFSSATFVLESVTNGVVANSLPVRLLQPGDRPGLRLKIGVTQNGKPSSAWEFVGVRGVTDASGRRGGGGGYAMSVRSEGDFEVVVQSGLCSRENAWKAALDFQRADDYPPEELWTVRGVPVPASHDAVMLGATTNLQGATLRLLSIIGAEYPEPQERRNLPGQPLLILSCENLPSDASLKLVKVTDTRGRKLQSRGRIGDRSSPKWFFALDRAANVETIDATFAITRFVSLTYVFNPGRME